MGVALTLGCVSQYLIWKGEGMFHRPPKTSNELRQEVEAGYTQAPDDHYFNRHITSMQDVESFEYWHRERMRRERLLRTPEGREELNRELQTGDGE